MATLTKIWRGIVKAGRFIADDAQGWPLAYCGHEGKRVEVTVTRERKKRSLNQNSYYRGVVIKLISEMDGQDPDSIHDAMRWKFLKTILNNGLESAKSTTCLNTVEMEEYLENIRRWADEFYEGKLYIPKPNEVEIK